MRTVGARPFLSLCQPRSRRRRIVECYLLPEPGPSSWSQPFQDVWRRLDSRKCLECVGQRTQLHAWLERLKIAAGDLTPNLVGKYPSRYIVGLQCSRSSSRISLGSIPLSLTWSADFLEVSSKSKDPWSAISWMLTWILAIFPLCRQNATPW